tara:strand:+ start:5036 stop:6004 length:969 start_codon:yes stop_codon:yes gene_type:complete
MALTTTTIVTDQILAELLAEIALDAARPKNVASLLANFDSIDGRPTGTLNMPRYDDIGPAAAVAENADVTSTTLANGTQASFTPSEYAIMAEITFKAARERVPGMANVAALIQSGTVEQILAAFANDANRLGEAMNERIEIECVDALSSLANSVGTTTVDLSIANLEEALYTFATLEVGNINDDLALVLAPRQVQDLRAAVTSSSNSAAVFSTDIQSITSYRPDNSTNGLIGAFMGVPVYQLSQSVVNTANAGADVEGALIQVGRGSAVNGQRGSVCIVEGSALAMTVDHDMSKRSFELQATYEFDAGLRATDMGVLIVTDA